MHTEAGGFAIAEFAGLFLSGAPDMLDTSFLMPDIEYTRLKRLGEDRRFVELR